MAGTHILNRESGGEWQMRTKEETQKIAERADYLRKLLREFNLTLGAFDQGVTAYQQETGRYGLIDFAGREWSFIEPLLQELVDRRNGVPELKIRKSVLAEAAAIAGGHSGPGNTRDNARGYSAACREISRTLRNMALEAKRKTKRKAKP